MISGDYIIICDCQLTCALTTRSNGCPICGLGVCRVWPKEDERDVQLFVSLVHHVTGIKLKAHFVSSNDPKRPKVVGTRRKQKDKKKKTKKTPAPADGNVPLEGGHPSAYEHYFGARVRCFAALRRFRLLCAGHFKPFNSGLLAGEALVSPFFGLKGAPHAKLPVCVEAAFPFRPEVETAAT